MKVLHFLYRFRVAVVLGMMFVSFTANVMAQPDPISILSNLPEKFQWAWFGLAVIGMPIHWLKQAIWKEVAWDTFDDHFFHNFQWTLGALAAILTAVVLQTDMLATQPLFSTGVLIALLSIGWNADSGVNSPGNKMSAKTPPKTPS